jgi:hypothetical protein
MKNKINGKKEKIRGVVKLEDELIRLVLEMDKEIFNEDPTDFKLKDADFFKKFVSISNLAEKDEQKITRMFPEYVKYFWVKADLLRRFYDKSQEEGWIRIGYEKETGNYEGLKFTFENGLTKGAERRMHILSKERGLNQKQEWEKGQNFERGEMCIAYAGRAVRGRVREEKEVNLFKWGDEKKAVNPELKAIIGWLNKKFEEDDFEQSIPESHRQIRFDLEVFIYLLAGLWHRGIRDSRVLAEIVKEDAKNLLKRKSFSSSFYFGSLRFCFLKMNYYSAKIYYLQYNISCNRKKAKSLYIPFCRQFLISEVKMSEVKMSKDIKKSEEEVKTSIRINRKIWEDFKGILPKSKTMSKAIEELIKERTEKISDRQ